MKFPSRATLAFSVVLVLQFVAAYFARLAIFASGLSEINFSLITGALLGQFAMFIAWLALWEAPWRVRLVCYVGLGYGLLYWAIAVEAFHGEEFEPWWWMLIVFLYLLLAGAFWLPRLLGWRFVSATSPPKHVAFLPKSNIIAGGLSFLLILGGALVLFTRVNLPAGYRSWEFENDFAKALGISFMQIGACLPGLLCLVSVLYRGKWRWFWRGSLAVILALVLGGLFLAYVAKVPLGDSLELLAFEGSTCAAMFLISGVLALGGWQLKRAGVNLFETSALPVQAASPEMPSPGTLALYKDSFRRHLPLWIVIGVHCAYSAFVGFTIDSVFRGENQFLAFGFGVLAAQPVLGAIWLSLYRAPLRSRLPAVMATAISSLGLFIIAVSWDEYRKEPGIIVVLFLVGLGVVILLLSIPYLIWRALARSVIVGPSSRWPSLSNRGQFTLADLMLWTAGFAIVLGIGRWVLDFSGPGIPGSRELVYILRDLPYLLQAIGFGVLVALPEMLLAIALLHTKRRRAWVYTGLGLELAYCLVLLLFFIGLGERLEDYFEVMSYYLAFKLGGGCAILGTLAILLNNGYHTERLDPEAEPVTAPLPAELLEPPQFVAEEPIAPTADDTSTGGTSAQNPPETETEEP